VRHTIRAAVLLAMAMILPAGAIFAQGRPGKQAETLFELANQERADRGLPQLRWDEALAAAAQKHADRMAQADLLSHQLAGESDLGTRGVGAGAHFSLIAENVAEGPDLESIHASWMLSVPHRENLLDPRVDSVGIAVSEHDGRLFAVQDFSRYVRNLSIGQQEKQFGALLAARGLRLLTNIGDAEKACKASRADTARQRPLAMVWFETTDLSSLPASLELRIRSGHYGWAAVGACPSNSTPGFASYRIAVLLY
jgi:hypothetical protein